MEADVESRLLQFVERQLDQGNPLADNNAASGLASQKMSPPPTYILYFLRKNGRIFYIFSPFLGLLLSFPRTHLVINYQPGKEEAGTD